jgi:type 2A phosphatase activator TIP41
MATLTPESTPAPPHKLTESPNTRGIEIGDWQITTATNPIANALVLDELHNKLKLPLPEMTFANNYLLLEHKPSGWKYTFDAAHALAGVKNGPLEDGDGGVKVGHSEAWLKSR